MHKEHLKRFLPAIFFGAISVMLFIFSYGQASASHGYAGLHGLQVVPSGYALVGVGYGSDDHKCVMILHEAKLVPGGGLTGFTQVQKRCYPGGAPLERSDYLGTNMYSTGWTWWDNTSGGSGWRSSFDDGWPEHSCRFQAYRKIDAASGKLVGPILGWGASADGDCNDKGYRLSGNTSQDMKFTFYVSDIPDPGSCSTSGGFYQCAAPTVSFSTTPPDSQYIITGVTFGLDNDADVDGVAMTQASFAPPPPPPTATCTANVSSVAYGGTTTFTVSTQNFSAITPFNRLALRDTGPAFLRELALIQAVDGGGDVGGSGGGGGTGGIAPYSYLWSYPSGLASCPNSTTTNPFDSNFVSCKTAPLLSNLNSGSFKVTVKSNTTGNTIGPVNCPAVTVTGAPATIQVTSMNSVTLAPVNGSWYFPSGPADPCNGSLALCSGTSSTYPNQLSGVYNIGAPHPSTSSPSGYAFSRTEKSSLASLSNGKEFFGLSFLKEIFFKVANAVTFGCISDSGTNGTNSCFLSAGGLTIFNIFWDPLATMFVSPTTVSLSATTGASAQSAVTVSNGGTVGDGSTLQWSASSSQSWLSLSPASGADIAAGSSATATITANAAGLAVGTYTGTITFTGTSNPNGYPIIPSRNISVTLVVTPAYPSVSCSPPSQTANVGTAVNFSASGGDGAYSWSASGGSQSSGSGSSFSTTYSAAGTKTVTVTSAGTNDSCDVNVVALSCTFTADPTNITVPQPTTLSWSCTNADACNITPTVGSVNPISGNVSVSPTSTTIYTLSCTGAGGGSYVAPVEVQVATSTLIEV